MRLQLDRNFNYLSHNNINIIISYHVLCHCLVTGDANFSMDRTSLVVGGFTQPVVARALIEQPGSIEKGLAQRFLWMFPQPVFAEFASLEPIEEIFTDSLGNSVNVLAFTNNHNFY